jgi:hypothetical protein
MLSEVALPFVYRVLGFGVERFEDLTDIYYEILEKVI